MKYYKYGIDANARKHVVEWDDLTNVVVCCLPGYDVIDLIDDLYAQDVGVQ